MYIAWQGKENNRRKVKGYYDRHFQPLEQLQIYTEERSVEMGFPALASSHALRKSWLIPFWDFEIYDTIYAAQA